ncbi:MAG: hypothetical protein HKO57_17170, partial [Akkermansiaceae bacterium]|nr:hypothetical protein [Akkermansiaceae bacterium]
MVALIVVAGLALVFLPQIATGVIARLTANLDLEDFSVKVEEVRWNEARLTGLAAANPGWRARAGTVVVEYNPWDLLDGTVRKMTLHDLELAVSKPAPATGPGPDPGPDEKASSFAWLHRLPEAFANCPGLSAPAARLTVSRGEASIVETFDLALLQESTRRLSFSLTSARQALVVDLETAPARSTLTV